MNALATTYYVAKTGNDSNNGTSEETPFLTIAKAESVVTAGDIVYIKRGVYQEKLSFTTNGTASNYITFSAWKGDKVTIDGSNLSVDFNDPYNGTHDYLVYVNASYRKFRKLRIKNSPSYGLRDSSTATKNIYDRIKVSDCYVTGIEIQGTYNTFKKCESSYNYDYGLYSPHSSGTTCTFSLLEDNQDTTADAYTKLLLLFEGTDASTTFTDVTGKTVTPSGNAQIDTAQYKYGTASGLFDGTGDYLVVADANNDLDIGTNDFCIEFWFRPNNLGSGNQLVDFRQANDIEVAPYIFVSSSTLKLKVNNVNVITGSTTLQTGTWYHVAVARSGTSTKMFLNGVQEGSTYTDNNNYIGVSQIVIGAEWDFNPAALNGWLDMLRISVGTPRYTNNFANIVKRTAHGLSDNNVIVFTNSGGAIASGLSTYKGYYIVNKSTNYFQVSTTQGGTPVTLTNVGTGTNRYQLATRGKGGDADGISANGNYNTFYDCYAHHNSDDGWDFYNGQYNKLYRCKASHNGSQVGARGRDQSNWTAVTYNGNGNGFKMGGEGLRALGYTQWQRYNYCYQCLAWNNIGATGYGFTNNNGIGCEFINCTAYNNTKNYFMYYSNPEEGDDIYTNSTSNLIMKNNVSYASIGSIGVGTSYKTVATNSWDLNLTVASTDFVSTNSKRATFLRAKTGGQLEGVGTNVGFGTDLGWKKV